MPYRIVNHIANRIIVSLLFALFIFAPFIFVKPAPSLAAEQTAYFAGGCFWCTEHDFEKLDGVTNVVSGYMGGFVENPTYKQVSGGQTGHFEIVRVDYDTDKITYQALLSAFWRMHDPSDGTGSFCDRGLQYSTAIFYTNEEQRQLAEGAVAALEKAKKFSRPIATRILSASQFYPAEDYHQNYSSRNPLRYKFYRSRCGRDQFINKVWKDDNMLYQSTE
ncbi:MAG: peptide-methionine (S)-S-oxide reductase MsrA [Alphaproteobacteria bacterium]|nr:peptide-methionine (S)-S-oxide reductase MsrA [Alphaproteobacteria bacterium]